MAEGGLNGLSRAEGIISHQRCPSSNATRNNIDVKLTVE